MKNAALHLVALTLIVESSAFVATNTVDNSNAIRSDLTWMKSSIGDSLNQETKMEATPPKAKLLGQRRIMSAAIPFVKAPAVLQTNDMAGNFGFDPLGLAQNEEQLVEYREAEIKHARLAMLAAIGWPMSEILDRPIAEFFGVPSALGDGDMVPSIMNGGMSAVSPIWWGFCIGLSAAIDIYGIGKSRSGDLDYFPGNLGFDPLGLYGTRTEGQDRLKLAEIKHGRLAMIAVLGFVVQEFSTKMAVVNQTPTFFQPLPETIEESLKSVLSILN